MPPKIAFTDTVQMFFSNFFLKFEIKLNKLIDQLKTYAKYNYYSFTKESGKILSSILYFSNKDFFSSKSFSVSSEFLKL